MKAIAEAGGVALIQNPASAFASAMPEAAAEMCPSARVMSLDAIAAYLQEVGIRP
jgi:two-component system chemotaxis response regulator CheB